MREKQIVTIFGAGSIGKGFLGLELYRCGYELNFVDSLQNAVDKLNLNLGYEVDVVGESKIFVPVRRATSIEDQISLTRSIKESSLILTAVGPSNLEHVADALSKCLYDREDCLNIVACENMVENSSTLRSFLPKNFHDKFGFPDCVVDRISTFIDGIVRVEKEYECIVESKEWKGERDVAAINYVQDLTPFLMRKLYMLNGTHATIGFAGQIKGIEYVHDALDDLEIYNLVKEQLEEVNYGLINKYNIDRFEQENYIEKILKRFGNRIINDRTIRLTKGQIRKLKRNERLIGPALLALNYGLEPVNICKSIGFLLRYFDENYQESRELHDNLRLDGLKSNLLIYSNLEESNYLDMKLLELIEKYY